MPRAVLSTQLDAPEKTVLVPEGFASDGEYIAIRSAPQVEPIIRWSVVKFQKSSSIPAGHIKARPFTVASLNFEDIEVEYRPVEPVKLTRVVLSAPVPIYEELSASSNVISLPPLVKQGEFIADIRARVRACEPVDQGLFGPNTSVVVVAETPSESSNGSVDIEGANGSIIGDFGFHTGSSGEIEVEVTSLHRPINPSSLRPVPDSHEDLENIGLLRIDQFTKLGLFSGDCATISTPEGDRTIRVYAFPDPEPTWAGTSLCLPPILIYNLGSPKVATLRAARPEEAAFVEAKDIVLSRIASPASTNRANQQAFLNELRAYFTGKARVVKGGDIIAIPIDTLLAQSFQGLPADVTLPSGVPSKADDVVFFKVEGGIAQSVFNPSHTRMVQSGLSQAKAVPASLGWLKYFELEEPFSYPSSAGFAYFDKISKLLRASLTPQGASLGTTILLTSTRRGSGKTTVLDSAAKSLGIHQMVVECYELVGDGDTKALGTLTARLDRAAACGPCMVVLRHLDALAKKGDQDGRDGPITSDLIEILHSASIKPGLILAATAVDADKLAEGVRSLFKFEIDIPVPTEKERKEILSYLTAPDGSLMASSIGLNDSLSLIEGYSLRGDVSVSSLAMQSAGLIPPDLVSIVKGARQSAYHAHKNDEPSIICQRGIVKISPKNVESSVSSARDSYSDSIGAPKIPNVGWKDVGGLDTVKGEIMDTIDMPLKYPQLFASGLKKRSGILFYGPPGTGKTLLAKAIATSFSLNFFSVKGPELLNMYIGESEANVRRVFQKARDAKPCVVFFDELDSVAPKRGNQGDSGGVMDRIVSQLLAELDGMSAGADGVFVIGATNRPDLLDEALLRPGRFDKMLYLGVSDTHDKQRKILEALTRKFDLASDVNLQAVAENCPYTYTGADFYAMSSDAMLNAMTRTAGDVDAKIAEYNAEHVNAPLSTRAWFQKVAKEEDTHVEVSAADFAKALRELIPSVSADELAHYQQVRATFEGAPTSGSSKGAATNGSISNGSQIEV